MLYRFKEFLTPPTLDDDELSRIASLLNSITWSAIIITLLLIPFFLLLSTPLSLFWILIAMLVLELGVLYLMHIKRIKAACLILTLGGWIILFLPGFFQGGLSSPLVLFSIVILLVTVLLLGSSFAIPMVALTIIALTVMYVLGSAQILPNWIPPASLTQRWFILMVILFMVAYLSLLVFQYLRNSIASARNSAQLLEDSIYELEKAKNEMEQLVEKRTSDLEEHIKRIQSSFEISNAIASKRDLNMLLDETVKLIGEQFGYHLVSIFLADRTGQALTLRASNQEDGRNLVARGLTLEAKPTSIVGRAADTFSPYIAKDVTSDPFYLQLANSSESQITVGKESITEIALPLIAGGRLLGVLDIQDKNNKIPENLQGDEFFSAFDRDQTSILQSLAENITIAIENSFLISEKEKTIEEIQRTYSSFSGEAWQKLLRSQNEMGYVCSEEGEPVVATGEWDSGMLQARNNGEMIVADEQTIAFPIKIREQVAGVIKLRKPEEKGGWSEDELDLLDTLNERLSIALETAQLYNETRKRAERERLTGEITAKLRASNDPRIILQTAAREIRRALQADQAQLLVQSPPLETRTFPRPENKTSEFPNPILTDDNLTGNLPEQRNLNFEHHSDTEHFASDKDSEEIS